MTPLRPVAALALALVLLPLVGCEETESVITNEPPDFQTTLGLEDAAGVSSTAFQTGETVTMILTIRNNTDAYQTLRFPTSQIYDFVVTDPSGAEVWRWSKSQAFNPSSTRVDFRPRQTMTFREPWTQIRNDGTPVAAGDYDARGEVPADVVQGTTSQLVRFTIQ